MVKKQLTSEEMTALSLATKGESYDHRRWPAEVVRAFASATVVTARRPQTRPTGRRHPYAVRLTWPLRHG